MKEYFSPKSVIKKRVYALIGGTLGGTFLVSIYLYLLLIPVDNTTTKFYDLSTIWHLTIVIYCVFTISSNAKKIYEPVLRILDGKIEIKIGENNSFWETTWANLSHIEARADHIDGDRSYEYVCFKRPVTRAVRFLGLKLWTISKQGFYLDILDERAKEEIKARIS